MSRESKLSTSVLMSSESDRDPAIPVASSVYASSDLVGDIDNLNLEPCYVCTKKATNKVNGANWYCRECKDLLCHDCKGLHSLFSGTDKHSVVTLHPPCDPCAEEKQTNNANWYCNDCAEFLCNECKSQHKKFKISKRHSVINSAEIVKQGNNAQENVSMQDTSETSKHQAVDLSNESGIQTENISRNERQAPLNTSTPFTARTVKAIGRFNIASSKDGEIPWIWSSAFLPDSRLLIADNSNSKLKVFDAKFQLTQEKMFKSVFCVSVFDTSEVAVLHGYKNITRLSFIKDISEKDTIQLNFSSYSIAYISRDTLAITSISYPAFFCVYSTSGTELSRISADSAGNEFVSPFNLTVDRERSIAYVADSGTVSVRVLDLTGSKKPTFNYVDKSLVRPEGLTVDQEGYIYVCDPKGHTVHQISLRGEHVRTLLSQKNGLKFPTSISFAPDGFTFIVAMKNNTIVLLFKME